MLTFLVSSAALLAVTPYPHHGQIHNNGATLMDSIANLKPSHIQTYNEMALLVTTTNPDRDHIQIYNGGSLIIIKPNGFSSTFPAQDTINLQWVFNNYPSATIILHAGIFHVSQLIEGPNFTGSLLGLGVDQTYIVGRGPFNSDIGNYEFPLLNADLTTRLYPSSIPHLFWFHAIDDGNVNNWMANQVNLTVKNLTVRLDGVGPAVTYIGTPIRTIWSFFAITAANPVFTDVVGNISHVQFDFENVVMTSQSISYVLGGVTLNNPNTALAILSYGAETWVPSPFGLNGFGEVNHKPCNMVANISNCIFNSFWTFGTIFETPYTVNPGSNYSFPTNPVFPQASINVHNNIYNNISSNPLPIPLESGQNILVLNPSDTYMNISNNIFNNITGAGVGFIRGLVISGILQNSSTADIHNNIFNLVPVTNSNAGAVQIIDNAQYVDNNLVNPIKLSVHNNYFSAPSGFQAPIIFAFLASQCSFSNNVFSGSGPFAISIGATPNVLTEDGIENPFGSILPGTDCIVVNNDFSSFTPSIVNIILGTQSADNRVTVFRATDVLDTGSGNQITVH